MEVERRPVDSTDTCVALDVHGIPLVDAGAKSELAIGLAHLACIFGLQLEHMTSFGAGSSHVEPALAARLCLEMSNHLAVAGLQKAEGLGCAETPNRDTIAASCAEHVPVNPANCRNGLQVGSDDLFALHKQVIARALDSLSAICAHNMRVVFFGVLACLSLDLRRDRHLHRLLVRHGMQQMSLLAREAD